MMGTVAITNTQIPVWTVCECTFKKKEFFSLKYKDRIIIILFVVKTWPIM